MTADLLGRGGRGINQSLPVESLSRREIVCCWLLALACFALLIFFFSPSWAAFRIAARVPELQGMIEVRRGASVLLQVQQPGVEIPDALHTAIRWRLFFPVVGHLLHLPPKLFFSLAHVGCVLALGFMIELLRRNQFGWGETALGAIVLGAGGWFFASTGWLGYFDSWLVLALLLVAFASQRWVMWAACTIGPWIDERFVIGAILALACRYLYFGRDRENPPWLSFRRDSLVCAGILVGFLAVRFGWLATRSSGGATLSGYFANLHVLEAPFPRLLLGGWEGLRAGWIFVAGAVVFLAREHRASACAFAVVVLGTIAIGLGTAQDFGRSMMLILPVALLGLVLARASSASWMRRALPLGAGLTLLLPAHHVMSDRVNPIFYFYHELAAFDTPPPAVMPELHELRAIHAMERGDFVQALEALSLAIRLAPDSAAPRKQRGILFASLQRWKEAREDFSAVVDREPKNPDGWFLRAQAALTLGETAAAKSDAQQALSVAPPGWSERPDVARFFARLPR